MMKKRPLSFWGLCLFILLLPTVFYGQSFSQKDSSLSSTLGVNLHTVGIPKGLGTYFDIEWHTFPFLSLLNTIEISSQFQFLSVEDDISLRFYMIPRFLFIDIFLGAYLLSDVHSNDSSLGGGVRGGLAFGGRIPFKENVGLLLALELSAQDDNKMQQRKRDGTMAGDIHAVSDAFFNAFRIVSVNFKLGVIWDY